MIPRADASCDGGNLDCGSGLLLIIRNAMLPLRPNGVLEVKSREGSVREDLPAWCRMVGHTLLDMHLVGHETHHYYIMKKSEDEGFNSDLKQAREFKWKIRAKGGEGLHATVYARNHSFEVGQPASFDTEDERVSALEYFLGALAGCLVAGFQWRLSRERIEIGNLELSLHAQLGNVLFFLGIEELASTGHEKIAGTLYLDAQGDDEMIKSIWNETLLKSPVLGSLNPGIQVKIELKRI